MMSKIIQRGDCFKLLAACFYEPEKQLFVEEEIADKLAFLLKDLTSDGARAAQEMRHALQQYDQEKLSIDHAALFVGPFALLAVPYGSVYIEKKRAVMGDSSMGAARYYAEAGLTVDIKEPPDHIVIELEFMYYLCNKEADALAADREDEACRMRDIQVRFFNNALRPWVFQFCESIEKNTDNSFYLYVGQCLNCFMLACKEVYSETSVTTP